MPVLDKSQKRAMSSPKRIPLAAEAILGGGILLGVLVATTSPITVLSDSPILASFADFIASLIPGIDKIANVSKFPEITRLTSAVLWASVPLQAILFAYPGVLVFRLDLIRQRKVFAFFCWLTTPLLTLMPAVASFGEITSSKFSERTLFAWGLRSVSESTVWLGVLGGAGSYAAAAGIFIFIAWWPRAWPAYFISNRHLSAAAR